MGVSFSAARRLRFLAAGDLCRGSGSAYSDGDIVRLADGRFLTVLREHQVGGTYQCYSSDEGQTWTELRPTGFVGANFKLHRLRSGAIVCLYRDEDPERYGTSVGVSPRTAGKPGEWAGSLYARPPFDRHIPGLFLRLP